MGFISWIIFGAIAGWIASKIMKTDAEMGGCANILVGIVGSSIGGFLSTHLLHMGTVTGFNIRSFFIAILGSVVLLFIVNAIRGR
ncbi:MAG: GlsB/YeaQ/YmgE family stress response membrane protein [Tissierellia bacterium]|nr:GlsB/YeaQ/YmgE family stress response membrane protein [Tissierellia bacterium]